LWNLRTGGAHAAGADESGQVHQDGALSIRYACGLAMRSWPCLRANYEGAAFCAAWRRRWARHDGNIFATAGQQGTLRFHHLRYPQVPQTHHVVGTISDLAWHRSHNLCAVASDRTVSFWIVS